MDHARRREPAGESTLGASREEYGIGAVSGGVDYSGAAALVRRAVGMRYWPLLVGTGRPRKDEAIVSEERLEMHVAGRELMVIDSSERFYPERAGVTEPAAKRDFIGLLLIECVEQAVKDMALPLVQWLLMRGTL